MKIKKSQQPILNSASRWLTPFFLFKKITTNLLLFITLLGIGSLTAQALLQPDARGYLVKVGDPCPDFTLQFPDGSQTSFTELKGRVIMLQFTASWCSVCRKEMPYIEREIWQPLKDQGLVLIGVDRDEPADTVLKFAAEMQITYPLALDPGATVFSKFAAPESGVTRNVIIDQEGTIAFLTRLYDREEFEAMITVIRRLLNNSYE